MESFIEQQTDFAMKRFDEYKNNLNNVLRVYQDPILNKQLEELENEEIRLQRRIQNIKCAKSQLFKNEGNI